MAHDLTAEHPTATHFILLAASDRGGGDRWEDHPASAYAWEIETRDGQCLNSGAGNALRPPIKDWHTAALFDAAIQAVTSTDIPRESHVHFISDMQFFTGLLNADRAVRRQGGYKRSDGKPLAYTDKWRALDDALNTLGLMVSAGPPQSDEAKWALRKKKNVAVEIRRNIGNSPGEWNAW